MQFLAIIKIIDRSPKKDRRGTRKLLQICLFKAAQSPTDKISLSFDHSIVSSDQPDFMQEH